MIELRPANCKDLTLLRELRTRAVALEAAALAAGHKRLFLSASLNAVAFYERAGFVAVREELYPHRSGIAIPSVYMEKHLNH